MAVISGRMIVGRTIINLCATTCFTPWVADQWPICISTQNRIRLLFFSFTFHMFLCFSATSIHYLLVCVGFFFNRFECYETFVCWFCVISRSRIKKNREQQQQNWVVILILLYSSSLELLFSFFRFSVTVSGDICYAQLSKLGSRSTQWKTPWSLITATRAIQCNTSIPINTHATEQIKREIE